MKRPAGNRPARIFRLLVIIGLIQLPLAARPQSNGAIAASSTCEGSVLHQTAKVGDTGQHTINLDQRVCAWSPAITIGGAKGAEYTATGVDDIQFNRARDQGYAVGTLENGDKYFLRYEGTSIMNGPVPMHLEGRWHFTGSTGKLAGLKGSGTYKARPSADGRMLFGIEGKYAIPSRASK